MSTGIPYASVGGGNPTIQNQALLSRYDELAPAVDGVIDGADIPSDGVVLRGTLLLWTSSANKYHAYLHGTDDLSTFRGKIAIAVDNIEVKAGIDKVFAGYREGFFNAGTLVDSNTYNNLVIGDLVTAAGFYAIPAKPGGTTTEFRLIP